MRIKRFIALYRKALTMNSKRATNELHALFMHATEFVLHDDALLEKFNIPRVIWPRIHQSWNNRRNEMVTGRLDFSLTERGLKVYEYNSDSASCHMDAGKVQGKWATHFGCQVGRDPGAHLLTDLVDAWKSTETDAVLHIMIDRDLEETYHALYMKEALDAAGIESKLLQGLGGLAWTDDGDIVDADGESIRWVWKTWAWETALDQMRAECEEDEEKLSNYQPGMKRNAPPRLVDVLLRPDVMVFEPLWTLIPSNKAILPILWQLFAGQRYLLNTAYELTRRDPRHRLCAETHRRALRRKHQPVQRKQRGHRGDFRKIRQSQSDLSGAFSVADNRGKQRAALHLHRRWHLCR